MKMSEKTTVIPWKDFMRGEVERERLRQSFNLMGIAPAVFFSPGDVHVIWGAYGVILLIGGGAYAAIKLEEHLVQNEAYENAERVARYLKIVIVGLLIGSLIVFMQFNPLRGLF